MRNTPSLILGLYLYGTLLTGTLTLLSLYLVLSQSGPLTTPLSLAPLALYFGYRTRRYLYRIRQQRPLPFSYSLPLTIILYIIALGATLIRGYATIISAGVVSP